MCACLRVTFSLSLSQAHTLWPSHSVVCRIQVITETSCAGYETPQEYGDEYGVVDGWNDVHTATGLWQLLQVMCLCVSVSVLVSVSVSVSVGVNLSVGVSVSVMMSVMCVLVYMFVGVYECMHVCVYMLCVRECVCMCVLICVFLAFI